MVVPFRLIPARAGKTSRVMSDPSQWEAHPRACGENALAPHRYCVALGSSPRVRGKRRGVARRARAPGLIPARAGKTSPGGGRGRGTAAHPRACGENTDAGASAPASAGSSPRVRGKRPCARVAGLAGRLIPARAGKTPISPACCASTPAHPRACGENAFITAQQQLLSGSSPRVRGKRTGMRLFPEIPGLIPARAGKTSESAQASQPYRAHPRACGENLGGPGRLLISSGSSPRVRGKLLPGRLLIINIRLIPARAGKTRGDASACVCLWAHPRACGENAVHVIECEAGDGSSPRVRGKPVPCPDGTMRHGLIPARAGKTPQVRQARRQPWAHPRACGENLCTRQVTHNAQGSSPRVRGKLRQAGARDTKHRLIPARAGKTATRPACFTALPAHPRACGENFVPVQLACFRLGSSPRVRGKHFLTWAFTAQAGQILETLEPSAFSGSYSFPGARANGGQCRARRRGLCTGPALGRPLGAS